MRMTMLTKLVDVQEAVGVLALIDEANCSWQQTVLFQSLCPGQPILPACLKAPQEMADCSWFPSSGSEWWISVPNFVTINHINVKIFHWMSENLVTCWWGDSRHQRVFIKFTGLQHLRTMNVCTISWQCIQNLLVSVDQSRLTRLADQHYLV